MGLGWSSLLRFNPSTTTTTKKFTPHNILRKYKLCLTSGRPFGRGGGCTGDQTHNLGVAKQALTPLN